MEARIRFESLNITVFGVMLWPWQHALFHIISFHPGIHLKLSTATPPSFYRSMAPIHDEVLHLQTQW